MVHRLFTILFLLACGPLFSQVPSYVPTSGLQGFWSFTGNANDVSGNGNHGVMNGATLTTDRFNAGNSAYSFNGTTDYISVPASTLAGYTDMSISAWVNLNSLAGIQGIVCKWYQVSCAGSFTNSDTYELAAQSGSVQFATNNNNISGFTSPPQFPPFSQNTWVHLVSISRAVQGQAIYINGTLAATFAVTGGICNSINTLYFGADYHGTSNFFHRFLNGKIDDIGIWNRALSACEIQQLYTSAPATVSAISSYSTICSGNSTTLTGFGVGSYTWNPAGISGTSVVVSPVTSTIYTLTSSCASSATIGVQVTQTPSLSATSNPSVPCAGSSLTLTASGATTYTWLGIGSGSAIVVNPQSSTTYTMLGSNAGCTATLIRVQSVFSNPSLSVLSTDTTICNNTSVNLLGMGADSYTWFPGNHAGASFSDVPSATTIYTLVAANNFGCQATATWTIFVNSAPLLNASASPSLLCPGNSSTLTVSGASSYTWLPSLITGPSIVVSPSAATVYTVIADNGTCPGSATVIVNIGLDISLAASGNLCNNSTVNLFTLPGSALNSYAWTGPGIVGSATGQNITINQGGVYSVTVNNSSNCAGTASINILSSVNLLTLTIIPSSTAACFPGPAVNLLVSAPASLSWFPSAEVTPNTGPLVSVNPTVTTTYTVFGLLGTCSGSAAITISVNITPSVSAVASNSTPCTGIISTLTAEGAMDYFWMPGNLNGPTVTVNPHFTTTYTLTGVNGNCATSVTLPLSLLPLPTLTAAALPATICIGQTATLTAGGATSLAWLIGDPPPVSHTAVVNPDASTTYTVAGTNSLGCSSLGTVALSVINSPAIHAVSSGTALCAGESITLTAEGAQSYTWFPGFQVAPVIINTPTASVEYTVLSENALCSSATLFILVTNCINTSFGVTNAAAAPEQYGAEMYKVRFTVTVNNASDSGLSDIVLNDDLSATFGSSITFTVINPPAVLPGNSLLVPNPSFNGSSELSLTSPGSSTLAPATRDTLAFTVLIDPKGFAGTVKNSVIGFARDKNNILASDTSNNGFELDPDNDGNPTNNNAVTPIEIELFELFIPEGFSPDDDGTNDLFIVKGLNGRKAKITIFNRWGNKVYYKEGTELTWDGKANMNSLGHDKLPPSTYYYIFEFLEGKNKLMHGFIVLRY